MSRKSGNIVSFTVEELQAKRARGETRSDRKKAAALPIRTGAIPTTPWNPLIGHNRIAIKRPKAHASLRLDADMLDWFKAQGRGYQTKINAILRSYYQSRAEAQTVRGHSQ